MNHNFNHFLKNAVLISLAVISLTIILIHSYMDKHDLTFDDFFESSFSNYSFNIRFDGLTFDTIFSNHKASDYKTLTNYQDDVFEIVDNITISSTTEEIIFVHEDRSDIRVVYSRKHPNTPHYKLNYTTHKTSNHLAIESTLSISNLLINKIYSGSITLYLPNNYDCDQLTINSVYADIYNSSFPKSIKELTVTSNIGNIDFELEQILDKLVIELDMGNADIIIREPIDTIHINVNSGNLAINIHDSVKNLTLLVDLGNIEGDFIQVPDNIQVRSNLGNITLDFGNYVTQLDVTIDIGDIDLYLLKNDDSTVYYATDIGHGSSDIRTTDNKREANIILYNNIGSIDVHSDTYDPFR